MSSSGQSTAVEYANRRRAWRRYAILQPLVWLGLGVGYFAIEAHQVDVPDQGLGLADTVCWAVLGCLLASGLALLYCRLPLRAGPRPWFVGLALLATAAGALLWFLSHHQLVGLWGLTSDHRPLADLAPKDFLHGIKFRAGLLLIWHGAGMLLVQRAATRRALARELELERVALEAQIAQLRGQLNPHFLFNSLNSAIALIDEDSEAAKRMLLDFSRLLRDTVDSSVSQHTDVGRELELVRRYVRIEQRRFEQNLVYEERADPATMGERLPPFLLLPLVENAIKHGMRTSPMPLRLELTAEANGPRLILTVSNTGRLAAAAAPSGDSPNRATGIRTLRDRLAVELGSRGTFSISEREGRVHARLALDRSRSIDATEGPA